MDAADETAMTENPTLDGVQDDPHSMAPALPRRRGRPGGAAGGEHEAVRLEGQTMKSYALGEPAQRTVRYLRMIVNQRQIPDGASVSISEGRVTIEWSE
jgi:hypothetical protein